jgi:acyl-coenzyme A synthetase/AMP-(fatty) acid ligase
LNVYPRNVEDVLMSTLRCKRSAWRQSRIQTRAKVAGSAQAWVVLKSGETLTSEQRYRVRAEKLARYEIPTRVEFVSELPRT